MSATDVKQWDYAALGDLAAFRNGVNYNKNNFGKGIKVINVKDFQDYSIASYDDLDEINPHGVVREESLLQDGDILFVRSNGNRDLIGRSLFIRGMKESVTHSAFTIRARISSHLTLPRFYAYLFRSSTFRRNLSARGSGTNISNLNQDILSQFKVPVPPIGTQRKIASILSAYDDLIENNTRRIKILEEMAQALYREWFVHFRFPGHEKIKMVPSPLGPIPQGWHMVKLGSVADVNALSIKNGEQPEHVNYIDISSVSPGRIDKVEHLAYRDAPGRARRIVRHGDIIWSTVRPNRRSYTLVLDPLPNLIVSTGFAVITPNDVPFSYVYLALTTDEFVGYLTNRARGSAYPAVNGGDFEGADFLLPVPNVVADFHSVAADILVQCETLTQRNANLRRTRDLLLPKLILGEIDVSSLEKERV
ncbi:MAG TPA: restriction endonuclease subunit S [Terriglobia bacterium]|nr:restriction endonuclease subunit S [Terriglobia bacterium]